MGAAVADHGLGSLVVGVGASKGVPVAEVLCLIEGALREAGLSPGSVAVLATADAKADEPGLVQAAERLGVPLVAYAAEELAAVEVPNPSDATLASVGTPSVAEAAALMSGGQLLVPKRKSVPHGRAVGEGDVCRRVGRCGAGRLAAGRVELACEPRLRRPRRRSA